MGPNLVKLKPIAADVFKGHKLFIEEASRDFHRIHQYN